MNDTPIDLLQVKIEQARDNLPKETRKAIDSVDWRSFVLSLREKKGFSFEQLEDLELETELLLCGLIPPEEYPKEIEKRLNLPKSQVDLLVNEMNEAVFLKIREELIKNTEKKDLFEKKENWQDNEQSKKNEQSQTTGDQLKKKEELPIKNEELKKKEVGTIPFQKLTGSFQMPATKTEYSMDNFKKEDHLKVIPPSDKMKTSKIDPYRIDPNE